MQPSPLHSLTGWQRAQVEGTLTTFYTTIRAGMVRLSDGGGPFGFDVTVALLVDDLLAAYQCDAIVETGCFLGDTTDYLARRYPGLPVLTCDIDPRHAEFTRRRLAGLSNASVYCMDSPHLIRDADCRRPLCFLDAHWGENWPLLRELAAITHGVALIHDFDIGHPRFGFDTYDGVACGPNMLARLAEPPEVYFTPNPEAAWPLPCLQVGRRAGVGIVAIGLDEEPLYAHPNLITRVLKEEVEDEHPGGSDH